MYQEAIAGFDIDSLPDLDAVVLAALELLASGDIPRVGIKQHSRPLVVGSVNAARTGQVMFREVDAVFADEGNYQAALKRVPSIDAVYIVSASGNKHAITIARDMQEVGLPTYLITNNPKAGAREFVEPERVYTFPRLREPYTYNTSTYMSMMLGSTREDPQAILDFIHSDVLPCVPDTIGEFDAYLLTVRPEFGVLNGMFVTKFDELFGPMLIGRAFTSEQMKHAKTVVASPTEGFINFASPADMYGLPANRLCIPLPKDCGPVAMLAIGYYVIGHIQRRKPPYFKDQIVSYTKVASELFNQTINPIVG